MRAIQHGCGQCNIANYGTEVGVVNNAQPYPDRQQGSSSSPQQGQRGTRGRWGLKAGNQQTHLLAPLVGNQWWPWPGTVPAFSPGYRPFYWPGMLPWHSQPPGDGPAGIVVGGSGQNGPNTEGCHARDKVRPAAGEKQSKDTEEIRKEERVANTSEPRAKGTDPTKVWVASQETGVGKLANEYLRPSPGDLQVKAKETGLSSPIPLAIKERIWRKDFIDIFSLLEVQHTGLDLCMKRRMKREGRSTSPESKEA
ncbi:hypothetical protein NDU88_003247 [Pleurodeles waltl]|uniref:Uncharacterized protein n=1 Tax=Pleurodeles waltl TaxID=8319 RepID=A0AAV7SER1_PLEWA|nr:hypothetical protein NDU88_003247 [Pleurodeles waltl]